MRHFNAELLKQHFLFLKFFIKRQLKKKRGALLNQRTIYLRKHMKYLKKDVAFFQLL